MKRIFAALLAFILCVSANAASFTDTQTHWAKESIDYVADKGLFKGTSDTVFSPELTMNRAMLCTVLYRYAGSPAVAKSCTFGDVPADVWYTDAMAWAQSKAIIPWWMCDKPTIQPDEGVSRAEFASMLFSFYRYLGGMHYGDCNASFQRLYPDLLTKGQAESWDILNRDLAWAYSYGILNGTATSTMSPLMTVTRAQIAAILQRFDSTFFKSGSFADCEPTVIAPLAEKAEPTAEEMELIRKAAYGALDVPANSAPETEERNTDYSDAQTDDDSAVEEELIRLINDYRVENGLEPLVRSEVLMKCADIRVQEIKVKFAHTRPDGTHASTVVKEITGLNYGCSENCARGCYSAEQVFNCWKDSPGHNNLMLNETFTTIGICYAEYGGLCAMDVAAVDLDALYYK